MSDEVFVLLEALTLAAVVICALEVERPILELDNTDVEVGLEVAVLDVATGDAMIELVELKVATSDATLELVGV